MLHYLPKMGKRVGTGFNLFNNTEVRLTPGYYVQQLLEYTPDNVYSVC